MARAFPRFEFNHTILAMTLQVLEHIINHVIDFIFCHLHSKLQHIFRDVAVTGQSAAGTENMEYPIILQI